MSAIPQQTDAMNITEPEHSETVDINDELVRTVITVDDGCDHTPRLIWLMNRRRNIRNKVFEPEPQPIKVTSVRIEARKPKKYRPLKTRKSRFSDIDELT